MVPFPPPEQPETAAIERTTAARKMALRRRFRKSANNGRVNAYQTPVGTERSCATWRRAVNVTVIGFADTTEETLDGDAEQVTPLDVQLMVTVFELPVPNNKPCVAD